MPVLVNPKHERFAQGLAAGKSASEAYVDAGFKANTGNAATLKGRQSVSKRMIEILADRESRATQATAKAIEKTALTKEWIIESLIANATAATEEKDYAPANRALELLGKELGMFIDRKEIRTGALDGLNADDRARVRESVLRALAGRAQGVGPAGQPEQAGSLPALH